MRLDQTLHRVATKEREEIKIMRKMPRRHNKEGGNHLEQVSNRQKAMEDIDVCVCVCWGGGGGGWWWW